MDQRVCKTTGVCPREKARALACHIQCQHAETLVALTAMEPNVERHQSKMSFVIVQ